MKLKKTINFNRFILTKPLMLKMIIKAALAEVEWHLLWYLSQSIFSLKEAVTI